MLRMCWNLGAGLAYRLLSKRPGVAAVHYPLVWRGRAGFLDCDATLHLDNAAYLFSMELARWHYTTATGILWQALKHRRMFIAGSQTIRYQHGIPAFHAYEVHTQLAYWDDRWIYFLHQFQCPTTGRQFAEGVCRVTVKQGSKWVTAPELLAEVYAGEIPSPPSELPETIKGFLQWDAATRASMESSEERSSLETATSPPAAKTERPASRIWTELRRSMNRVF